MLKSDGFSCEDNDFVEKDGKMRELTVTITLSEYRYLVASNALLERDVPNLVKEKEEIQKKLDDCIKALAVCKAPEWIRQIGRSLANFGADDEETEDEETEATE